MRKESEKRKWEKREQKNEKWKWEKKVRKES